MAAAAVTVLGPLIVDGGVGDGPVSLGPRDRVVLAALAVRPGDVVSAERLADALWGERPPASWNKVVPGCVMRLRRALGTGAIETTPHGYRLAVPADEIDAQRFERLVVRGQQLLTLGEPERAAHVLGEGLALWRGEALVDVGEWEPGRIEAARLEELRRTAEDARLDACLQSGQHREVLGEAQARVAEAPLRERRWALLALALYQAGRQGEALRTLRQARTVLASELGLDPGPELVALEQAILRQEPALVAERVRTEASAVCPYLGLVPYDIGDAEGFFGRDAEVADCVRRLTASSLLAVVGPSGCGKSSLLRAGVAAALQRDGHTVDVVTPGAHPMSVLGWLPPVGHAVLVVDQCEEAVSLCEDPAERAQFFTALADRAEQSGLVVVALRADHLADLSAFPAFARLVERGLFLLGAMTESNLRAAIEGPAHQGGLLLEPGFVDLLVRDVEREPGALPLLSHALRETWERREGRTLTVARYQLTGGIRGAVARSAEQLYEGLPARQRPLLRDLLLRLVASVPDGEPIRSRVPRRSLSADADQERLIELLVAARLVTSDDEVVELAHEALARAWPRLREWLDDDVDGQRIMRHLTAAADAWDTMGRPDSELYRGLRLTHALDWRNRARPALNAAEQAFLDAGEAMAGIEQRSAEAQACRQMRINRRLRGLLVGVATLLVVAVIAGLFAWRQADRANTATIAADARRVAALALDVEELDRALLLAVEGVRLDDTPETRASLLAALSRDPALIGSAAIEDELVALDVSPDGRTVAVGGGGGVSFYDAGTLDRLGHHEQASTKLEFRPDGEQLAVATNNMFDPRPVRLLETSTFADAAVPLGGLPLPPAQVGDLDYSADGSTLAVSIDPVGGIIHPSAVMVFDVDVPERPIRRIDTGRLVWAVALSHDGRLLYVMSSEWDIRIETARTPTLTVYDVVTGQPHRSTVELSAVHATGRHGQGYADLLEISPDGATLAVGGLNDVLLLDAAMLSVQQTLRGTSERVLTVEFSYGGTLLASGGDEGNVVIWNLVTNSQHEQLHGHAGPVWGVAFSPDDATLYSTSKGLRAWDLRGNQGILRRLSPPQPDDSFSDVAAPAPDGESVAYLTTTGATEQAHTLRFRDVLAGTLGDPIVTQHGNRHPTWRPPEWGQLATIGGDGFLQVWDRRRNELAAEREVAPGYIGGISYTIDGRHIVVGQRSGTVSLVDADTLEPVGQRTELGEELHGVFVAPDDRTALVLLQGTRVASIDLIEGRVLDRIDLGVDPAWLDVSADGTRLAVGAATGEVGVVDLRTGEWARPPTEGHAGWVTRVAYAPDGATFVSAGQDGRIIVWDGHTGERLATVLPGEPDVWAAVEYLPDGHTVIISTRDGATFLWDTTLEHWIDFACTVAGRNFTPAEWRDAFGDRTYRESCPTP